VICVTVLSASFPTCTANYCASLDNYQQKTTKMLCQRHMPSSLAKLHYRSQELTPKRCRLKKCALKGDKIDVFAKRADILKIRIYHIVNSGDDANNGGWRALPRATR
jgi:excinuclease UvrABC helicase subunit UvrB